MDFTNGLDFVCLFWSGLTPLPPGSEDSTTPQPSAATTPGNKVMDTSSGTSTAPPPAVSKRVSKSKMKPAEQSTATQHGTLQRQQSQLNFSPTKSRACVVMWYGAVTKAVGPLSKSGLFALLLSWQIVYVITVCVRLSYSAFQIDSLIVYVITECVHLCYSAF